MKERILGLEKGRIDYLDPVSEELEREVHVSLFESSPPPARFWPDKYKPNQKWYVCLNWREPDPESGEEIGCQSIGTDWMPYHQAIRAAIQLGKKLNLNVVKQGPADITVLWSPTVSSTTEQEKAVEMLQHKQRGKIRLD